MPDVRRLIPRPTVEFACGSMSMQEGTRYPNSASAPPRLMEAVVFPTPPDFWFAMGALVARSACGGSGGKGRGLRPTDDLPRPTVRDHRVIHEAAEMSMSLCKRRASILGRPTIVQTHSSVVRASAHNQQVNEFDPTLGPPSARTPVVGPPTGCESSALTQEARLGGGETHQATTQSCSQLTARERIELLLDDGSFVEAGRVRDASGDRLQAVRSATSVTVSSALGHRRHRRPAGLRLRRGTSRSSVDPFPRRTPRDLE